MLELKYKGCKLEFDEMLFTSGTFDESLFKERLKAKKHVQTNTSPRKNGERDKPNVN